ncbi:hypothetical protein ACSF6G_20650 [Escherichia coli]
MACTERCQQRVVLGPHSLNKRLPVVQLSEEIVTIFDVGKELNIF